jgi:CHAT domain-containing protein
MTSLLWRSMFAGLFVLAAVPSFGQAPANGTSPGTTSEGIGRTSELITRLSEARSLGAQRLISLYDTDGDGKVSLEEFLAFHRKHFKSWDRDGDGAITRDEYLQGCIEDQLRQVGEMINGLMLRAGSQQPSTDPQKSIASQGMEARKSQQMEQARAGAKLSCNTSASEFMAADTERAGKVLLGQPEARVKELFARMDSDNNGFLTGNEILVPVQLRNEAQEKLPFVEVFHRGLEAEDLTEAGNNGSTADFVQMVNATEMLRLSGLADGIARVKALIADYQKRYTEKPAHLQKLRMLLADLMINAGQLTDAEDILVDIATRSGQANETTYETLSLLQTYAKLLCKQNRSTECISYAEKGIALVKRREALDHAFNRHTGSPLSTAAFRIILADAYMQEGRWEDAARQLGSATEQMASTPSALPVLFLRSVVAFLKLPNREPNARKVLETLKHIVATAPKGSLDLLELETSLLESVLLFQEKRFAESHDLALRLPDEKLTTLLGDRAAALKYYLVAAAVRRGSIDRTGLSASRSAVMLASNPSNEGYSIFTQLLDVRLPIEENLFSLNTLTNPHASNEAFTLIQRGTTNATGNAIAAVSARFATGQSDLAAVIRERQDLSNRRDAMRRQLLENRMGLPKDASGAIAIESELPAIESRMTVLDKDIAQRYPDYAELVRPGTLSVIEAQKLLRPDQAIVSWFVGQEASWAVVVRSTGTKVVRLPAVPQILRRNASTVRKAVELGPAGFLVFPAQKAYELYDALLAPLATELAGVKTLYAVPDSTLASLPLSLLLTKKPAKSSINPDDQKSFARAPWLIRDFAISVLPTVSSLRALQQLNKAPEMAKSFFGAGDPLLADHPSLHKGNVASLAPVALRAVKFRGVLADVGEVAKLPSLPETADELTKIAANFPEGGAALNLRAQATEGRVRSQDLSHYRVLAFATHGLIAGDFRGMTEPGLVLTPPAVATKEDDGLLVASEVTGLKLNADWVLLSACNTGADNQESGTAGLGGLAKAFFYAGARTLMVSHWRVPSKATVELTTQTIAGSLDGGMGKAETHRRAMLVMIASGNKDQAHPSAWAAFATVGLAD